MNRSGTVVRLSLVLVAIAVVAIAWLALRSEPTAKEIAPRETPATVESTQLDPTPTRASPRESVTPASVPTEPVAAKPTHPVQVFGGHVLVKEDSSPVVNVVVKISLAQGGTWLDTKT